MEDGWILLKLLLGMFQSNENDNSENNNNDKGAIKYHTIKKGR